MFRLYQCSNGKKTYFKIMFSKLQNKTNGLLVATCSTYDEIRNERRKRSIL